MDFFVGLENLALSAWVRESMWGYPIIQTVHAIGMALVVGVVTIIDLRLLGAFQRLPVFVLVKLLPLVWLGFVLNAGSGLLLYLSDAVAMTENAVFLAKIATILAGFLLALTLRREVRENLGAWAAGGRAPARAQALALASLAVWYGAIVLGRYTGYLAELMVV